MSIRTIAAVLDYSPQRAATKLLLLCIASAENAQSQQCNPSVETLAWYMNVSTRYVKRLEPKLIAAGELVVIHTVLRPNQYFIPIYPDEPGYYDPGDCDQQGHTCNGHHGPILNRDEIARVNNPRWRNRRTKRRDMPTAPLIPTVDNSPDYPHAVGNHRSPQGEREFPTKGNHSSPRRGTIVPPNLKSESESESEGESSVSRPRGKISEAEAERRRAAATQREAEMLYGRRAAKGAAQ